MQCLETTNFTTYDEDHDRRDSGNCANATSSGWWLNGGFGVIACPSGYCKQANLNGVYGKDSITNEIVWNTRNDWTFIEMKIQPYRM